jgi:hypothetical protein
MDRLCRSVPQRGVMGRPPLINKGGDYQIAG